MFNRKELIEKIIDLNNFQVLLLNKRHSEIFTTDMLWNKDQIEPMFQRYYLVELLNKSGDYDNPIYTPAVKVRYLLRSAEARKYGASHEAFYKRYLETSSFTYEQLADIEKSKEELKELFKNKE